MEKPRRVLRARGPDGLVACSARYLPYQVPDPLPTPRVRARKAPPYPSTFRVTLLLSYPPVALPARAAVIEVIAENLDTVDPDRGLVDDVIVEAWMQVLWERLLGSPAHDLCRFMRPDFLTSKLAPSDDGRTGPGSAFACEHAGDAFDRAVVFVPVFGDGHWSLAVVFYGCIVLHVDSLCSRKIHGPEMFEALLAHLTARRSELSGTADDHGPVRLMFAPSGTPQQSNVVDCALFMLKAIEGVAGKVAELCETAVLDTLRLLAHQAGPEYALGTEFLTPAWFTRQEARGLRRVITAELMERADTSA
jgi:hypothetical protein